MNRESKVIISEFLNYVEKLHLAEVLSHLDLSDEAYREAKQNFNETKAEDDPFETVETKFAIYEVPNALINTSLFHLDLGLLDKQIKKISKLLDENPEKFKPELEGIFELLCRVDEYIKERGVIIFVKGEEKDETLQMSKVPEKIPEQKR